MSWWEKTVLVLAAIGAINWILFTFGWDLVDKTLGSWSVVANVAYWIIGLCGIWALISAFK